ncbi:MAG: tryptophan-rich sensory protein [Elusimicrobiaceae bacterium]|nr:tryptophan-rich sensory protein [Elusimicrobiaceae bacterium]
MQLAKLVLWILVWQVPMWMGVRIVRQNMDWYHSLNHPFFSPPDWLFGMVWAVLYILLALAAFYITRREFNTPVRKATWLIIAQLVLNAAWTPLFFGLHHIMGAMILVLAMIAMTLWLMRAARPISRAAVWLLIPYLAWLCFAWLLNTGIWLMN